MKFYKSPFLRDFWHLNVAMLTSNNALIPDPDKEDILASKPTDWPWLNLGLRMCGWGDTQAKYYLIGTPIIWWGTSLSLVLSLGALAVYLLRQQRKYVDMDPSKFWEKFILGIWADRRPQVNGTTFSMSAKSHFSAGPCTIVSLALLTLHF